MITIDEHELTTNNITKQCKNSMERVEAKIGNSKKPMFDVTEPDRVYYSDFGYTNYSYNNVLPYGEYIQDQKGVEVNEDYIELLYIYIGSKVGVPGKYSIPVLDRVKLSKRNASGNPIGE